MKYFLALCLVLAIVQVKCQGDVSEPPIVPDVTAVSNSTIAPIPTLAPTLAPVPTLPPTLVPTLAPISTTTEQPDSCGNSCNVLTSCFNGVCEDTFVLDACELALPVGDELQYLIKMDDCNVRCKGEIYSRTISLDGGQCTYKYDKYMFLKQGRGVCRFGICSPM